MIEAQSENLNEQDALGSQSEFGRLILEMGTVGWDDGQSHFDIGATSNDGNTLVKVTLFRGYDPSIQKKDNVAQGHRVLAQIMGPSFYIPPAGARVLVGFPQGYENVPGSAVILGVVGSSPTVQFSGPTGSSGGRAVIDFGANTDVIIKGKSVVIGDYSNRYLAIGPTTGIKCGDTDASGFALKGGKWLMYTTDGNGNAAGTLQMTGAEVDLVLNDGSKVQGVKLGGGQVQVFGDTFSAAVGGGYLGGTAIAANGIAYTVAGPANVVSTSWYVSP